MSFKPPTEEAHSVRGLIALQKRLCQSKSPFVRRVGMLLAAGVLDRHLDALSDKQVGQLMFDHVGRDLGIVQPEATICNQATQRLFRSEIGCLEDDGKVQPDRASCPKCGNEALLHYRIDEPDFRQCVFLGCGHKEYVLSKEAKAGESA
jgi:ribosomal protein S27AE